MLIDRDDTFVQPESVVSVIRIVAELLRTINSLTVLQQASVILVTGACYVSGHTHGEWCKGL